MAEQRNAVTAGRSSRAPTKLYRSLRTGRVVTEAERIAAARTRVVADTRRGVKTAPWIVELSKKSA